MITIIMLSLSICFLILAILFMLFKKVNEELEQCRRLDDKPKILDSNDYDSNADLYNVYINNGNI